MTGVTNLTQTFTWDKDGPRNAYPRVQASFIADGKVFIIKASGIFDDEDSKFTNERIIQAEYYHPTRSVYLTESSKLYLVIKHNNYGRRIPKPNKIILVSDQVKDFATLHQEEKREIYFHDYDGDLYVNIRRKTELLEGLGGLTFLPHYGSSTKSSRR